MTEHDCMHDGDITPDDIAKEIQGMKDRDHYPDDGWKFDGDATTLTDLAHMWAEQEGGLDPEDRGSFPFWLQTHIDADMVTEPDTRVWSATRIATLTQSIEFEAPVGLSLEEAKAWFWDNPDKAIVSEGDETALDEELYVEGSGMAGDITAFSTGMTSTVRTLVDKAIGMLPFLKTVKVRGYDTLIVHIDDPDFKEMASSVFALDSYDAEAVDGTEAYSFGAVNGWYDTDDLDFSFGSDDECGITEKPLDVDTLAASINEAVNEHGAVFEWTLNEDAKDKAKAMSDTLGFILDNLDRAGLALSVKA